MVTTPPPDWIAERSKFSTLIVESEARNGLVVAGPGTGKTFTFEAVLKRQAGKSLVITFINNLVLDLERRLGPLAEVQSFHGFCKQQLHISGSEGLSVGFNYYPPFLMLVAEDLTFLGSPTSFKELEHALYSLDNTSGLLDQCLRISGYYDTVGHTDCVYRVLRLFEHRRDQIHKYPIVIVDEYQDFNPLEVGLIALLGSESRLLIAGDDDQALYAFKDASPEDIRRLHADKEVENYELPFCSRCTEVIVTAVANLIGNAIKLGCLKGRIPKRFEFFPPDKAEDSQLHPSILWAECTVENKNAPYICRYVEQEISKIPPEDFDAAGEANEPAVLIIGPKQFIGRVNEHLNSNGHASHLKKSSIPEIKLVDGYDRLQKNNRSNLGWRIVCSAIRPIWLSEAIGEAHRKGRELIECLPGEFVEEQLGRVENISSLLNDELDEDGIVELEEYFGEPREEIKEMFKESAIQAIDFNSTPILCTSFKGSKGLAARHVFIVGVCDGHFPKLDSKPTDEEICEFLVGLTRARKQCHIVTCGNFGGKWTKPSRMISWLGNTVRGFRVDKKHFA